MVKHSNSLPATADELFECVEKVSGFVERMKIYFL